jgi:type IV pilus assembly protein PilB
MSVKDEQNNLGEELVKQDVITREELARAQEREAATGTPWYRQLVQMGKISFDALENVLKHEFHPKSVRDEHETLGQTLVKLKAITEEQLGVALSEQRRSGRLLGNILLERGFVTRKLIMKALSQQRKLEYLDLAAAVSEPEALEAVPESVARKNCMLPLRIEGDRLTVLIDNPQHIEPLRDVGVLLGKRIYPILTTADDIRNEITARYQKTRSKAMPVESNRSAIEKKVVARVQEPVQVEAAPAAPEKTMLEDIARQAYGVPVVKLVSTILEGAVNAGATDIHLDPQDPEMRVRYRIDGILHDVMSIPAEIQNAVISRIKIMSEMDITETRHPQDGHMSLEVGRLEYDVRVATLPTYLGERVVLRLLDQSSVLAGIKDLGLEAEDEQALYRSIQQPYGMILVTGPTGSGKTTTLYSALNQKNIMTDSIVTLEDPVEYQLSGINQVQIDTDIDLTFANTLRAALRQDIDVLLVGEIRDAETARIAIRAAMTGHLVFSTLHTNDAPEALATLRNMGIPSYLIASALTAIVGQRLVRQICPHCKKAFKPTPALLKAVGLPATTKQLSKGQGCDTCYHTGCKGRTGIFEMLEVTPQMRKLIAEEVPVEKIIAASKLKNMAERCRLKVKRGIVAPEEYLRVIRV